MPVPGSSRIKRLAIALPLATLLTVATALAAPQDAPKPRGDGALEDLLKELKKAPGDPPKVNGTGKAVEKPKADETPKAAAEKPKAGEKPRAPEKPKAELGAKDKALDSLLEKLGAVEDEPTPEAPRPRTPPPGADKDENKAEGPGDPPQGEADPLAGRDKDLDEHLEELTGRRKKKKQEQEGEQDGPLSDVIKGMREVEQRLGKIDTGEETRKRQQEIVKNLETLIEEMRSSQSQSKSKPQQKVAMQKGQQPGQQQGQNPGANAQGAPQSRPDRPTGRRVLAGGKDEWGHLPPELRQELENVFKEEPLPAREELIRLYYLSVSKKSLKRGD